MYKVHTYMYSKYTVRIRSMYGGIDNLISAWRSGYPCVWPSYLVWPQIILFLKYYYCVAALFWLPAKILLLRGCIPLGFVPSFTLSLHRSAFMSSC